MAQGKDDSGGALAPRIGLRVPERPQAGVPATGRVASAGAPPPAGSSPAQQRAAQRPVAADSVSSLVRGLRRLNERYADEVEALQAAADRLSPEGREELQRLVQNRDRALARVNSDFQELAPDAPVTALQYSALHAKIEAAHQVMDDVNLHVMASPRRA